MRIHINLEFCSRIFTAYWIVRLWIMSSILLSESSTHWSRRKIFIQNKVHKFLISYNMSAISCKFTLLFIRRWNLFFWHYRAWCIFDGNAVTFKLNIPVNDSWFSLNRVRTIFINSFLCLDSIFSNKKDFFLRITRIFCWILLVLTILKVIVIVRV